MTLVPEVLQLSECLKMTILLCSYDQHGSSVLTYKPRWLTSMTNATTTTTTKVLIIPVS